MNRGDLFQRFFVRFLGGLCVAFLSFLFLAHAFQARIVSSEWREDLREQAHWLAIHTQDGEDVTRLANAWRITHSTIRLTILDEESQVVADSQPERQVPDLHLVLSDQSAAGTLAAAEPMPFGGWLMMSRPAIPPFPSGLQWEMVRCQGLSSW